MKKSFKSYLVFWVLLIGLFNLITFVIPITVNISKFTGAFWVGYALITVAFVAHGAFTYFSILESEDDKEKQILNMPIMYISFGELFLMVVIGAVFMAVPSLPYWLGIVICSAVLVFSVILLFTAKNVGQANSNANTELNKKTNNYRTMVDAADILVKKAETKEEKELAKKVYDAVRYGESVSVESTLEDETFILNRINELTVGMSNKESLDELNKRVSELLILIEQRNIKCKAAKRVK